MNDGSFATTVSAAGLTPAQREQLDAQIRAEGIPVTWLGDSLHLDQAFEARVETLVATARSTPAGPTPSGAATAGFVPTTAPPPPVPPIPAMPGYGPTPGYGPPPGYPAPYPAPGYYGPRVTNSNATISLVLGILAWTVCPITAIFGVIYGRRAQEEIDASGGTQGGEGLAKAGIIMSWVLLGMYGLMIVGFVVFVVVFGIVGIAASST